MKNQRKIANVVQARATSDGAGVRLKRSIGGFGLGELDPFLLLDEFKSDRPTDYIGGFPDHPHRGFETVTYMLAGSMRHRDSKGHAGKLVAGGVQWMTAARGIIHSEMPEQENGLLWGFQLWVNLPARLKMSEPKYQEFGPEQVPTAALDDGTRVKVIAGEAFGHRGVVTGIATAPCYLDVALPPGLSFQHEVPAGYNGFVYVFQGEARFGSNGTPVSAGHLGVLGKGDGLTVESGPEEVRFLLIAGQPLGEPVARYGPFVMNTNAEIRQAIEDYRSGILDH